MQNVGLAENFSFRNRKSSIEAGEIIVDYFWNTFKLYNTRRISMRHIFSENDYGTIVFESKSFIRAKKLMFRLISTNYQTFKIRRLIRAIERVHQKNTGNDNSLTFSKSNDTHICFT